MIRILRVESLARIAVGDDNAPRRPLRVRLRQRSIDARAKLRHIRSIESGSLLRCAGIRASRENRGTYSDTNSPRRESNIQMPVVAATAARPALV